MGWFGKESVKKRRQIEVMQKRLESLKSAQNEGFSTLKKQLENENVEPKKNKWRF